MPKAYVARRQAGPGSRHCRPAWWNRIMTNYAAFLRGAIAEARSLQTRLPVSFVAVDQDLALRAALMVQATRPAGLSLGDRLCLALAQRSNSAALTADRGWLAVAEATGVVVEMIR